jgi:DMSO reductase anchor subunit
MGLSSLTNIDKVEKVSQLFYTVSLLAAPAWWVGDNFKDPRAPNNEVVLCMANIMGVLCGCITAFTYLIRSEVTTKRILVKADYISVGAWGSCAALTVMNQGLYQDDKFMINVGIQVALTALYLYQSALFPRLYQSVMKASKSTAKPVLRSKSPSKKK